MLITGKPATAAVCPLLSFPGTLTICLFTLVYEVAALEMEIRLFGLTTENVALKR